MRSHQFKTAALCCIAIWILHCACDALAHACKAPSPQKIAQVRGYIAKLHSHDGDDLMLTASVKSGKGCYWELQFQSKDHRSEIAAYLSPDHRFVFSDVIDLQIDPSVEARQRQQELSKKLASDGLPWLGQSDAPITIVEFADFECPYCEKLSHVLEDTLKTDRSVKLVFRNFPLPKHPWARSAAEMSACAAMQSESGFWKLHDFFFSSRQDLNRTNIYDKAMAFVGTDTNLNNSAFKSCVDKHEAAALVDRDMQVGRVNNVHATPTMFVNGVLYQGLRDVTQLQAILESARSGNLLPVPLDRTQVSSTPPVSPSPSP
jgi:protein-disulfide isomerase